MNFVEGPVPIGEWTPDDRDLRFPNLAEARYVEPIGIVYKSFAPLVTTGGGVVPGGFVRGLGMAVYDSQVSYFAGTDDGIFEDDGGGFTARSATIGPTQYDFLQYDDLEIVAPSGLAPMYKTLNSASSFVTLGSSSGTAPSAVRVGKIGQFVFLGHITASHAVRWSGIDNPLSWPAPNSATAIAQQSGEQFLDPSFGEVTGFANGDQFGLIFQTMGITRVSYTGPPAVFQFDKISTNIGCAYPRSIVQVGGLTYFISNSGFHRTDGVTIQNIGENRVNQFFLDATVGIGKERVYAAHNQYRNLIYWAYPIATDADFTPSQVIIYNHNSNRFTNAPLVTEGLYSTSGRENVDKEIRGFGGDNTIGTFNSGTVGGVATIDTGDIEFNPGGFAHLSGAKLLVDQTANAVVAYSKIRNELVTAQLTASAASTTNSATGFSDFRREARYHRLSWEVTGVFEQAQAMEFIALASGRR